MALQGEWLRARVRRVDFNGWELYLLLGAAALWFVWHLWPSSYKVDVDAFCRGYAVGWIEGSCDHTEACEADQPDPCPDAPKQSTQNSFVLGVVEGMHDGANSADLIGDPAEDSRDESP